MDLEVKSYEYDNATGDWSHLCASLNASFCLREGSAMLQVAPQKEAALQDLQAAQALHAAGMLAGGSPYTHAASGHGDPMSSKGDEGDEDNADSEDAAAVSRRITRQSETLLRLLQGASSTQLSEHALAGLMALTDMHASTIEAVQTGPVESGSSDDTSASISW
jgi:hypothetical protein